SITTQPASQTITVGQMVSFSAAAAGAPTPTVQWQVSTNGGASFSNIAGATATTYSFTATLAQSGNEYPAVFTHFFGTATSTAATLTVPQAPVITTQPTNQTVSAGQTATFTAAASGSPSPTVQWQLSTDGGATFSNIAGATAPTLSFTVTLVAQTGNEYRAVFTNSAGSATSSAATLTVTPAAPSSLPLSGFPRPATAGDSSHVVTVTAYDPYGNVATGYAGTVHFSSSDGQAALPADTTLTNGTGTFSVTLFSAGAQSLTATDTVTS